MGAGLSAARQAIAQHGPIVPEELDDIARQTVAGGTVDEADQCLIRSTVTRLLRGPRHIYTDIADLARKAVHAFDAISYEWDADSNVAQLMIEGIIDNVTSRVHTNRKLSGKKLAKGKGVGPLSVRFMTDHSRLYDMMNGQKKSTQIQQSVRQVLGTIGDRMGKDGLSMIRIEARVWMHETLGSNHSKYFIQDGRRVVITGCNIDSYYDWEVKTTNARGREVRKAKITWHDTGMRMEGPVAGVLLDAYNKAWKMTTVSASSELGPILYPRPNFDHYEGPKRKVALMMLASKDFNRFNRNDVQNPQDVSWLYLMAHAQTHIFIETPNINDSEFQLAVLNAVHRGVEVRLITGYKAGDDAQQKTFVGGGTNEFIIHRLQAYLAAHEPPERAALFKPRWYSHDGRSAVVGYAEGQSHTKFMSVDGKVFMTGSGNQDTQSWKHSRETNVVVFDERVTRAADILFFNPDWKQAVAVAPASAPIKVASWLNSDFTGIV